MHPARLVNVCGLPGVGKTTRAFTLAERFGAVRLSPDDWLERLDIDVWDAAARHRVERLQGDLIDELLGIGTSVIVEWGTWLRAERDALRERAVRTGALVHLEFLDAPPDVLWQRISARGHEQRTGSRAITIDDVTTWSATIERPTIDEFATYDPLPPVIAGSAAGSISFPYGTWLPQSRPR